MACIFCGSTTPTRRIVDPDDGSVAAEVCRSCAEQYLLLDPGSPTCEFCSELARYSLVAVAESDDPASAQEGEEYEVIEEHVLCEEHLRDLRADAPKPS